MGLRPKFVHWTAGKARFACSMARPNLLSCRMDSCQAMTPETRIPCQESSAALAYKGRTAVKGELPHPRKKFSSLDQARQARICHRVRAAYEGICQFNSAVTNPSTSIMPLDRAILVGERSPS
jgi:hypothetical protein